MSSNLKLYLIIITNQNNNYYIFQYMLLGLSQILNNLISKYFKTNTTQLTSIKPPLYVLFASISEWKDTEYRSNEDCGIVSLPSLPFYNRLSDSNYNYRYVQVWHLSTTMVSKRIKNHYSSFLDWLSFILYII